MPQNEILGYLQLRNRPFEFRGSRPRTMSWVHSAVPAGLDLARVVLTQALPGWAHVLATCPPGLASFDNSSCAMNLSSRDCDFFDFFATWHSRPDFLEPSNKA